MAETAARTDAFRNFNFLVEIDGIAQVSFLECSGLGSSTEVIETREGGDNTTVRKLPGKTTFSDITLKWGMTATNEMWRWRADVIAGNVQRKNGSIVVFDLANHAEVARWNFVAGWPKSFEASSFVAKGNEIAVDTLVLCHEGLVRA